MDKVTQGNAAAAEQTAAAAHELSAQAQALGACVNDLLDLIGIDHAPTAAAKPIAAPRDEGGFDESARAPRGALGKDQRPPRWTAPGSRRSKISNSSASVKSSSIPAGLALASILLTTLARGALAQPAKPAWLSDALRRAEGRLRRQCFSVGRATAGQGLYGHRGKRRGLEKSRVHGSPSCHPRLASILPRRSAGRRFKLCR